MAASVVIGVLTGLLGFEREDEMTTVETPAPIGVRPGSLPKAGFIAWFVVMIVVSLLSLVVTVGAMPVAFQLAGICVQSATEPNVCDYSYVTVTAIVQAVADVVLIVLAVLWFRRRASQGKTGWWVSLLGTGASAFVGVAVIVGAAIVASRS